jgi:fucose 4-O-acetylase-like acetyltransferase
MVWRRRSPACAWRRRARGWSGCPVEGLAIRRHDIDWLRIAATFLLFPFHAARPFDHAPWHVKSATAAEGFDLVVWSVHQFHMPLFFVLAGWSLQRALVHRSVSALRRERVRRLLIPFLAGVVLLSPPQAYIEAITQKGFTGTFFEFLPFFFTSLQYFSWHHLWFLIYLFTFTMLYLPLLARVPDGALPLAGVGPRHVYLAIVPFAVVQLALRWRWPGYQNLYDDWANFAWYSLFFVGGFVVAGSPALEALIRRRRRLWALGFTLAILAMLPILAAARGRVAEPAIAYLIYWPLNAAAGVLGVVACLGYATSLTTVDGPLFRSLREAALPIYVLHQAVIVVLAYWLLPFGGSLVGQWGTLVSAALGGTLALHYLIVRPFPPLRAAFGMPEVARRAAGRPLGSALVDGDR